MDELCIQDIENMVTAAEPAMQHYSQNNSSTSDVQANFPISMQRKILWSFIGRMLIIRTFLIAFSDCEDMYTHVYKHG